MTDELKPFRAYHDSLPAPAPAVTARARARALLATEPLSPPVRPRRLSALARRTGAVLGLAAAMTAGMIMVDGTDVTSPLSVPPANAAELLQYAAAASAKEPRPRPGQFVYEDRKDIRWGIILGGGGRHEHAQEARREIWTPVSDPGRALARVTYGTAKSTSDRVIRAAGKVEYQRAGHCTASTTGTRPIGELPADPQRLLDSIRADETAAAAQPPATHRLNRGIERSVTMRLIKLVQNPLADSRLRATVFQAMSQLPTATLIPDLADSAGRHGLGVSVRYHGPDAWEREELVFEPKTYRFLGWRSWTEMTREDGSAAEVMRGSTALMTTKTVEAMPKVPQDAVSSTFC
ncbi:CU044_5270 family protein [Nonomuraea sp. ZG12]|uniref:CU044_5270 family protein n=1 Tax=Nonomuraea sp. ZG12 TaxID=3452207 RepID=UPI003F8CC1A3